MSKTFRKAINEGKVKIGDQFKYNPLEKEIIISTRETGCNRRQKFKTEKFESWIFVGTNRKNAVLISDRPTEKQLILSGKKGAKNGRKVIRKIERIYAKFPKVKVVDVDETFLEKYNVKLDSKFWVSEKYTQLKIAGSYEALFLTAVSDENDEYEILNKCLFDETAKRFSAADPVRTYGIRIAISIPLDTCISANKTIML